MPCTSLKANLQIPVPVAGRRRRLRLSHSSSLGECGAERCVRGAYLDTYLWKSLEIIYTKYIDNHKYTRSCPCTCMYLYVHSLVHLYYACGYGHLCAFLRLMHLMLRNNIPFNRRVNFSAPKTPLRVPIKISMRLSGLFHESQGQVWGSACSSTNAFILVQLTPISVLTTPYRGSIASHL